MSLAPRDGQDHRQAGKPFDPRLYLQQISLRGQSTEYLAVRWRVAWLRAEHPEARITTEHVVLDERAAVFRATVEIPGGGAATGYGSETRDDFPDYIEKAETKAIGRALAALGYGTQVATDLDLEESTPAGPAPIADAPVEERVAHSAVPANAPGHGEASAPEQAQQAPERASRSAAAAVPDRPRVAAPQAPRSAASSTPSASGTRTSAETAEFDAADYSWTEFWTWARSRGYSTRSAVEEVLGRQLGDMTPREIRAALLAHEQSRDSRA